MFVQTFDSEYSKGMNLVTKSKIPLPILSIPGRLLCTSSTHPVVDQFGWSCAIHYRFRVLLENSVMPGAPPVSTPNYISCFGTFLFSTSLDQRCRHLHHPSPWNRRGRGCKQVSYYEHKKKNLYFRSWNLIPYAIRCWRSYQKPFAYWQTQKWY